MLNKDNFKNEFIDGWPSILKRAMLKKGIAMQELADAIGYGYETIRFVFKGKGSYRAVLKICLYLEIDINTMIRTNCPGCVLADKTIVKLQAKIRKMRKEINALRGG